jgi:hypothetical protein
MRRIDAVVPFLIALAAATPGCISFCDCQPVVARALNGDPASINEIGELGRPGIPSSAKPLPRIDEGFDALRANLQAKDPYVRELTIDALRRLTERAPDFFRNRYATTFDAALVDEVPAIRWRAAWALGRIGFSNEALKRAVADKDDGVAAMACWSIGRARDDSALRELATALDRAPPVKAAALEALGRLTGQKLGEDVVAWKKFCGEEAARLELIAAERARIEATATGADTAHVSSPAKTREK